MAYKRCSSCKGLKTLFKMGGFHRKCEQCKGVGFEEAIEDKDVDDFLRPESSQEKVSAKPEKIDVIIPKKRGRKKRVA